MLNECYKETGNFVLAGEALHDVLMLDGDGKVTHNNRRYISRLVDQMAEIAPGRYLSKGVNNTEKKMQFRFYKQCHSTGCKKKWIVTCNKKEFLEDKVRFVFSENDEVCNCVQVLRPRPLIGNNDEVNLGGLQYFIFL